jgi:hypothetical protein
MSPTTRGRLERQNSIPWHGSSCGGEDVAGSTLLPHHRHRRRSSPLSGGDIQAPLIPATPGAHLVRCQERRRKRRKQQLLHGTVGAPPPPRPWSCSSPRPAAAAPPTPAPAPAPTFPSARTSSTTPHASLHVHVSIIVIPIPNPAIGSSSRCGPSCWRGGA